MNHFNLLALLAGFAKSIPQTDLLELTGFIGPATSASAAMTALALNAGSKKAAEWFYLSDALKSQAAHSIKSFEDTSRISLSQNKAPFFCSTILYLQGAAAAMQGDASQYVAIQSPFDVSSLSSTVSSLLSAHPAAIGYEGRCVQLFPSPNWRSADPPCEGTASFPDEDVVHGIALFSLKCLAAGDFDWRTVAPGYRPGGVSALTAMYSSVTPFSSAPVCSTTSNSDMVIRLLGMATQLLLTQLMVGPISAMLFMESKTICSGGFEHANCLRFENVVDLFFESYTSTHNLVNSISTDISCFLFRTDLDPFSNFHA